MEDHMPVIGTNDLCHLSSFYDCNADQPSSHAAAPEAVPQGRNPGARHDCTPYRDLSLAYWAPEKRKAQRLILDPEGPACCMHLVGLASEGKVKDLTDHLASKRLDIDERLLEHEEWNALQLACCEGDDTAVTTLLSAGASVDYQVDSHVLPRHSPLMLACRFGYIKVVKVLLDGGASANLCDNYGYTALHYACAGGHIKTVELLLKAGAHASTLSGDGSSPRDFALGQGHSRLSEILKAWEGKYSDDGLRTFKAWLDAIDCGHFFDQFVQAGYDLPFTAKHGLDDADLDCVGVPMSMLGLRKKLKALHRLQEFVPTSEDEDEESEEDDEGQEEEDEEEEEEG